MQVLWTEHAKDDLVEILSYIRRQSERNAEAVLKRIEDTVGLLGTSPRMGRASMIADSKELVVPRTGYLVTYEPTSTSVRITGVRRGTRLH